MSSNQRVALVLGSGGIVGGAFHAGVLKALHDSWHIDPRKVDLIVGTSAGSIAGALTSAGLHPNDLFRRETGQTLSPAGQRLLTKARAQRGPKLNPKSAIGQPAAPQALLRAITSPSGTSIGGVGAALLPRGRFPTDSVAGLIRGLFGSTWPVHLDFRVCTVEVATAKRVVFGRDDQATPDEAVAASCAVPAVFAPVKIDDREYYDGGVHSADNLDVLGEAPYDLVVVSSPMASRRAFDGVPPWNLWRTTARWQTDRERDRLTNCAHVEMVRPGREDVDAMGQNFLDPKRRPAVALQAYATASTHLARRPNPLQSNDPK